MLFLKQKEFGKLRFFAQAAIGLEAHRGARGGTGGRASTAKEIGARNPFSVPPFIFLHTLGFLFHQYHTLFPKQKCLKFFEPVPAYRVSGSNLQMGRSFLEHPRSPQISKYASQDKQDHFRVGFEGFLTLVMPLALVKPY